jgi:hypothetical protein
MSAAFFAMKTEATNWIPQLHEVCLAKTVAGHWVQGSITGIYPKAGPGGVTLYDVATLGRKGVAYVYNARIADLRQTDLANTAK